MKGILVRGARQLLTLRGPAGPRRREALRELGTIQDGSLLIANGVITSIGPTRRIENLAEARTAEEINAAGRVVMPAFVDSHTHLIAAPARQSEFNLASYGGGRQDTPTMSEILGICLQYVRTSTASKMEFNAKRYTEALLRHGTATIEAKSGYGLNESGEIKSLKVLSNLNESCIDVAATFLGAHMTPPEFMDNPDEYLTWLCDDLMPKIRARRLAQFAAVLCDPAGFTVAQARTYLECARRHGFIPRIHAEQTVQMGGVQLGVSVDAASVDGLNFAGQSDADLLARSRTIATLMPGIASLGTTNPYPPARRLIDSGAAVALATGFHPSVHSTFNMQMVISLACINMGMSPEEAISAATINGAHALQRAATIGSLEFGKDADLIMLDAADYREIPYHFGVNLVAMTMRKGNVVFRQGEAQCTEKL